MVWCAEFWRQLLPADLGGRGSVGSAPRIPGGVAAATSHGNDLKGDEGNLAVEQRIIRGSEAPVGRAAATMQAVDQDVNAAADAFDARWDACVSKCSLM
ncbi:unnamed protein product [Cladocopium goreaui]|uniref:Uncharacterized protein n=1 Tax=Cladocopium goreaui TaxID=2562237 RepID=A0A9P1DS13_9DINO|nr:unnamed protein product [Cladocopium goreaui]